MDLKIKNKWALITGGANGIGEEVSCQLAIEGVNIMVTSRSEKTNQKFTAEARAFKILKFMAL